MVKKGGLHFGLKWAKNLQAPLRVTVIPLVRWKGTILDPCTVWHKYLKLTCIDMARSDIPILWLRKWGKWVPATLSALRCQLREVVIACEMDTEGYSFHSLRKGGPP